MVLSQKGWRTITVHQAPFFWRARGTDWGITAVVVTAEAFAAGQKAQQLRFMLDYDNLAIPHQDDGKVIRSFSLRHHAVITPGVVRLAIERASALSPPFTGQHGLPDVSLPPNVVAELQAAARVQASG